MIRRLYWFSFLDDLMPIYPLYVVLFADHGLSTLSISVLFILWSVTGLAFEVPSGVLADKFDRRVILGVGEIIRAVGYGFWLAVPNLGGYVVGFVCWGIQGALHSGTFEALTFDELKSRNAHDTYVRVIGRCQSLGLIAVLVASAIAALMAENYTIPLMVSIGVCLVNFGVAVSLPKAPPIEEAADTEYFKALANGVRTVVRSRKLFVAIGFSAVAGSFYGSLEEYESLFVSDVGYSNTWVALISAGFGLITALGAAVAYKFADMPRYVLDVVLLIAGLFLFAAGAIAGHAGLAFIAVFYFASKLVGVVAESKVQHAIESNWRATVTSVSNFAVEIAALAVYLLFGLASHTNRFIGFEVCGATLIAMSCAFLAFHVSTLKRVAQ